MLAAPAALWACGGGAGPSRPPGQGGGPLHEPFAPVAVRVHPLTHVDTAGVPADQSVLVLHVELKDRFGDTVKGLGKLKVQLYRPGSGTAPGLEKQELSWEVPDLANPEINASRFDQATRTYRLPLKAPRWVADWPNRSAAGESENGRDWLKVRVVFTAIDADGSERFLEDEYVLQ